MARDPHALPSVPTEQGLGKPENHVDVADHPGVARWLRELARRDTEGFLRLAGPNRRRLELRYGAPKWQQSKDPSWTTGWELLEEALTLVVLTGDRSTFIYLKVPSESKGYLSDPRVGIGLTQFLQRLVTDLKA